MGKGGTGRLAGALPPAGHWKNECPQFPKNQQQQQFHTQSAAPMMAAAPPQLGVNTASLPVVKGAPVTLDVNPARGARRGQDGDNILTELQDTLFALPEAGRRAARAARVVAREPPSARRRARGCARRLVRDDACPAPGVRETARGGGDDQSSAHSLRV